MWWCSFSIHPNSMDMKISRSSRASCSVRLRASNAANSLQSQSHALAQCQCNKWRCACALDYPPQFLGRLLGLSQCTAYIYSRWDAVHRHSYTNHVQSFSSWMLYWIYVCVCVRIGAHRLSAWFSWQLELHAWRQSLHVQTHNTRRRTHSTRSNNPSTFYLIWFSAYCLHVNNRV